MHCFCLLPIYSLYIELFLYPSYAISLIRNTKYILSFSLNPSISFIWSEAPRGCCCCCFFHHVYAHDFAERREKERKRNFRPPDEIPHALLSEPRRSGINLATRNRTAEPTTANGKFFQKYGDCDSPDLLQYRRVRRHHDRGGCGRFPRGRRGWGSGGPRRRRRQQHVGRERGGGGGEEDAFRHVVEQCFCAVEESFSSIID